MSDKSYETIWNYFKRKAVKKKKMNELFKNDEQQIDSLEPPEKLVNERVKEKKDKNALVETSVSNLIPDVIRAEVNFLIFPFFALWDKDVKKRTETEVKMIVEREGEKLAVLWNVSANPKFGYPASFDKRVHKAIEQIIAELPRPIQNPISLGSFYNIFKRMGVEKVGGSQYKKIKDALSRIRATTVVSKAAFYSKNEEMFIDDEFGLYDRVVSKGKRLENGEIADTNYLYLNSWYLENINSHYVKPIDWKYYNSLENPISQRLYELLGVKFYGVIRRGGKSLSYKYSTLCDLLPATPQKYRSLAKQAFDPAHEKLKKTGFLAGYRWSDTSPKTKGDWRITYFVGKRVRDEIKKFKEYYEPPKNDTQGLPEPELIPVADEVFETDDPTPKKPAKVQIKPEKPQTKQPEPAQELTSEESDLIDQLTAHNVSKNVAEELVKIFDHEVIREWTQAIDYADAEDRAAYLVKAIKENWQTPEKYTRAKERIEQEAQMRVIEQAKQEQVAEEMERKKQEAEKIDSIYDSLSKEQKAEIDKEAKKRLPPLVARKLRDGETDSPMLTATLLTNTRKLIGEWIEAGKIKN